MLQQPTFTIRTATGDELKVTRRKLESLRMETDKALRESGYNPQSVTAACLLMDEGNAENKKTGNL